MLYNNGLRLIYKNKYIKDGVSTIILDTPTLTLYPAVYLVHPFAALPFC